VIYTTYTGCGEGCLWVAILPQSPQVYGNIPIGPSGPWGYVIVVTFLVKGGKLLTSSLFPTPG